MKPKQLEKIVNLESFKCIHKTSNDFSKIAYLGDRCCKCDGYNAVCLFYYPVRKLYGEQYDTNKDI